MLHIEAIQLHKMQRKGRLNTGVNILTILGEKTELGTTHFAGDYQDPSFYFFNDFSCIQ